MDPIDDIVPASGEREFRYSGSGLRAPAVLVALFGLIFAGVSSAFAVQAAVAHSAISLVEKWTGLLFIGPFLFVGIGAMVVGIRQLLHIRGRLVLAPTDVVWRDAKGKDKVRCGFCDILRVEEKVGSWVTPGGEKAPAIRQCTLTTPTGHILFVSAIEDYHRLMELFVRRQKEPISEGVFRNQYFAATTLPAMLLPTTAFIFLDLIRSYFGGVECHVCEEGVRASLALVLGGGLFFGVTLILLLSGVAFSLSSRIEVRNGRVKWVGPTGRVKVEVPLESVQAGSFVRTEDDRGKYKFQVRTPQGQIGWSDSISHCSELARIMQRASQKSPPGI